MRKFYNSKWFLVFIIIFVVLLNILNKLPALNPPSLWHDDVWVATIVKHAPLNQVFNLSSGTPQGFIMIQKLFYRLIPDPELSQQFFPFLCMLIFIPIMTFIIFKITENISVSIIATFLVGISPFLELGTRNKAYLSDCLVIALILFFYFHLLKKWDLKTYMFLSFFSVISAILSFVSIFYSFVFINLFTIDILLNQKKYRAKLRYVLSISTVFNLSLLVIYFLIIKKSANTGLYEFWTAYYLPLDDFKEFLKFCISKGQDFFIGPFFRDLRWMSLFIIPGLFWAFYYRKLLGVSVLLFYCSLFFASAIQKYPIGGGRTDIFSYPLTLVLSILGLFLVTEKIKFGPKLRWIVIVFMMGLFLYQTISKPTEYVLNKDAKFVSYLNKDANDSDAIIIYPHANFSVGYYGKWAIDLIPVPSYGSGYEVHLKRKNSLTLPAYVDNNFYRNYPEVLIPTIANFLKQKFQRVLYISTHSSVEASNRIKEEIINNGYKISVLKEYDEGEFSEFILFDLIKDDSDLKY